ncbi:hypothetical protein EG329_003848 [Mollisiaceae sp. DMI_Dod_QoI]|nr:hypothetical protein EG329_003848 [Helotiales sp. DMI_Dod_QoI]
MADEELTDDYVAKLLAKDAKETSIKYSALSLEAFSPSKPPANKPKPNTRFLRNIIKDTDSHNAALLAKEAAEARARLRTLPNHQEESKKTVRVGAGDIRRRQLGDIAAILGGRPTKRRRTETGKKDNNARYVNTSSEDEAPAEKSRAKSGRDRESREDRDKGERSRDHRSHHRRHRSASEDRGRDRKEPRKRDRSRSRSPRAQRDKGSKRRHRSPRRKRSSSPEDDRCRDKTHQSHRHRHSPSRESKKKDKEPETRPDYDSDPLDEIIGPRPPPVPEIRIRGRGTISHVSGIDARFSANYDPTADVQLDPDEENDWDQALEALRDRQKWKQQGADRLRAAGFTEDEISKWERGGEKRDADVKWAKQGEGREWDRGKVFDDDGAVKVESSFGRLTDV